MPVEKRFQWVDISRGIAIILVVVGHTLRGIINSKLMLNSASTHMIDEWIYAFHMPLFFFIAGMFLIRAMQQPFDRFIIRQFLYLGYPYFLWGTLQSVLQIFVSRYTNHPASACDLWKIIYSPPMQFWFLYVLFLSNIYLCALWKMHIPRLGILFIAALIFVVTPYLSLGMWEVLYPTCDNLLYLVLGIVLGPVLLTSYFTLPEMKSPCSLGLDPKITTMTQMHGTHRIAIRSVCFWLASVGCYAIVAGWVYFLEGKSEQIFYRYMGFAVASVGITATICLGLALDGSRLGLILQYVGQRTLPIFVAHTIASAAFRIGLDKLLHIRNTSIHLIGGLMVGIVVPLILEKISKDFDFPYVFTARR